MPEFSHASELPFPVEQVFAWHRRDGALERLLPPWEPVTLVRREGGLDVGATVVLRVGIGPATVTWRARHVALEPGRAFVDEQVEGPFASWRHEHRFDPSGPGACRMTDQVTYEPPLGVAGRLADDLVIRPRLERQFRYRHATVADDLRAHQAAALAPQRIALTGASGLIGSALAAFLRSGGHEVVPLVRGTPGPGERGWDPASGEVQAGALDGMDAVVHLAGEPIGRRWNAERKARIRESRVRGTRSIAEAAVRASPRPRTVISASAVGFYGHRDEGVVDERSGAGEGFLPEVAAAWEEAASPARDAGIRVVHPRFGIVLSPAGGALERMLPPFLAGAGGRLGSGRQWMPWVGLDDAIGLVLHALATPAIEGPMNVVAPDVVRNRVFTETLAEVLGRPSLVPVPAAALRLALGEMADALLLSGAHAVPRVAEATGYRYRHADLRTALRHVLGRA